MVSLVMTPPRLCGGHRADGGAASARVHVWEVMAAWLGSGVYRTAIVHAACMCSNAIFGTIDVLEL